MANLLSPGVYVSEVDLTTIIPSVGTTEGAFVGEFEWGPVDEVRLIPNEKRLNKIFGRPTDDTYIDFWTCANFLAYGNNLKVVRVTGGGFNASSNANSNIIIKNKDHYESLYEYTDLTVDVDGEEGMFVARYPGEFGNSIFVSMCTNPTDFKAVMSSRATLVRGSNNVVFTKNVNEIAPNGETVRAIRKGDILKFKTAADDIVTLHESTVTDVVLGTVTLDKAPTLNASSVVVEARWAYADRFDDAPGTSEYAADRNGANDELHIVVVDQDGKFTGKKGRIIEAYPFLSKAVDGRRDSGGANYYARVIKNRSEHIWVIHHPAGSTNWGSEVLATTFTEATGTGIYEEALDGGTDGAASTAAKITAWDKYFKNPELYDVSLVLTGHADQTMATYIKDLVEARGDALAFISPPRNLVVGGDGNEALALVEYRNLLPSSNRLVMDSAWKYQFDKYNNKYHWLPMNGDIAGLCVATDLSRDPWWSPAGFNRGQIKNCIKISWNPLQGERDELYKKGINPIVTFPGEGTILYGDKTMQTKPSAFDRINVRRLFDVLEKSISRAAKYSLFEFNDQFTRAQFVALVEPYLRDVQGRRGIYDFRVVCDETNNTPEVIDRNEFVGDIYIKPARSVNFIQLNFVAVRTGVNFDEITGKF